jgi:hypothetical protein
VNYGRSTAIEASVAQLPAATETVVVAERVVLLTVGRDLRLPLGHSRFPSSSVRQLQTVRATVAPPIGGLPEAAGSNRMPDGKIHVVELDSWQDSAVFQAAGRLFGVCAFRPTRNGYQQRSGMGQFKRGSDRSRGGETPRHIRPAWSQRSARGERQALGASVRGQERYWWREDAADSGSGFRIRPGSCRTTRHHFWRRAAFTGLGRENGNAGNAGQLNVAPCAAFSRLPIGRCRPDTGEVHDLETYQEVAVLKGYMIWCVRWRFCRTEDDSRPA